MNKFVKGALIAGAVAAAPAVINSVIFSRAKALGNPIGGEGRFWPWREGDLFVTRHGTGKPPIVLLHGIYAGASSWEWRKNFAALSERFTVYAIDWLGFGLSDKPKIAYSGEMYVEILTQFLRDVVGEPATVIASSLSSVYAIEAARRAPGAIANLVLVCPAGFDRPSDATVSQCKSTVKALLDLPVLGTSVYNAIASAASLRCYLQNEVYFDPSYVTDEMVEHYSAATHQYGSQHAALAFVSGQLGLDVRDTLPRLEDTSIHILWGREAKISPLSDAQAFLAANGRAELTILDRAGSVPHDEQAAAFNRFIIETLSNSSPAGAATGNGNAAKGRSTAKKAGA
ncbi:MAG: alpha/beta fold hydrolase [Capsulimonadaceae bacterium]|nr:alpha/beta fold hydrolase [Capsulimonadaceae bacterium]